MIKTMVMLDIPMVNIAAMERWYWKNHCPEMVRRYGPWMTQHESYLPVDAPPDAWTYCFYNWRVAEAW
jgi:hypothetical protein